MPGYLTYAIARLRGFCQALGANCRGAALVEMGMVAPVLVGLMLGGYETARFLYISQKVQRTAMTLADLAARGQTMDANDLNNLFAAAGEVARPLTLPVDGRAVVSSVVPDADGNPVVDWQRDDGALAASSRVGTQGDVATIADQALVADEQSVIVAEVFYSYEPQFTPIIPSTTIYQQSVFRPRLSRTVELE